MVLVIRAIYAMRAALVHWLRGGCENKRLVERRPTSHERSAGDDINGIPAVAVMVSVGDNIAGEILFTDARHTILCL